jgi:DNA-binding response OmpR family regulator
VRLPDGDGLDVVRAARALAPAPPAVVVTGFGSRVSHDAAIAAGASSFLTKPFTVAAFDAAIAVALEKGRTAEQP